MISFLSALFKKFCRFAAIKLRLRHHQHGILLIASTLRGPWYIQDEQRYVIRTLLRTEATPVTVVDFHADGTLHALFKGNHVWTEPNDLFEFIPIDDLELFSQVSMEAEQYGTLSITGESWGEIVRKAHCILLPRNYGLTPNDTTLHSSL
ncbi:hypothetical protein RSOL_393060, partial [Rhizoctonia solani AG-3 Rhs1AP]